MNNYNFENVVVERLESLSSDQFNDRERDIHYGFTPRIYPDNVSHDDGILHITYNGIRYCFDIGQDVSVRAYNHQANLILRDVGITGPTITGRNN